MEEQVTKAEIIEGLVSRGEPRPRATLYADAYLEYQESTRNIEEHGIIVQHPRTANPIENPYLTIRDRAAKKLAEMRRVKADWLW
jgi:phage terminase small subunit